jgi:hypothetical protein
MGEGNTDPRLLSGSLEDTLERFFSVWTLKRLKGVRNEDNRKIGFRSLIFLAKGKSTSSSASPIFRETSSSASLICQDDLLLSITYLL